MKDQRYHNKIIKELPHSPCKSRLRVESSLFWGSRRQKDYDFLAFIGKPNKPQIIDLCHGKWVCTTFTFTAQTT